MITYIFAITFDFPNITFHKQEQGFVKIVHS